MTLKLNTILKANFSGSNLKRPYETKYFGDAFPAIG
jgi:hypothetical protein